MLWRLLRLLRLLLTVWVTLDVQAILREDEAAVKGDVKETGRVDRLRSERRG